MTRYAVISEGKVANIIIADPEHAARIGAVPAGAAEIDDDFDGATFTRPVKPRRVPREVPMLAALLALSDIGIEEADVDAVITAMPAGREKKQTRIWWKRSQTIRRNSPRVAALAPALGLTDTQLDDLFIAAEQIEL